MSGRTVRILSSGRLGRGPGAGRQEPIKAREEIVMWQGLMWLGLLGLVVLTCYALFSSRADQKRKYARDHEHNSYPLW